MALNCKKGDIAIVVYSRTGVNLGKIVRCINFQKNVLYSDGTIADSWEIDIGLVTKDRLSNICPDSLLQPIRDQDGEDETLTWAPVPKEIEHA